MRYAIFTDIHANLEALEAVLAKIDELAQEEPIDQIWFLGDLVGYGPNPNECIAKLRERTDVVIAGNHDWAAVGKIDLEDFSEAARISAQWTANQLTEEHREFLANLPEQLDIDECLLVHGSPYGPLWEYLTSEVLAERSFQHFSNRFCFVGHTHVPVIFIQPDTVANAPTIPLELEEETAELEEETAELEEESEETATGEETVKLEEPDEDISDEETQELGGEGEETHKLAIVEKSVPVSDETAQEERDKSNAVSDETTKVVAVRSTLQTTMATVQEEGAITEPEALQDIVANAAGVVAEIQQHIADDAAGVSPAEPVDSESAEPSAESEESNSDTEEEQEDVEKEEVEENATEGNVTEQQEEAEHITPEETILSAEERLNEEIEELLALLGLSQSMISVTNEMLIPPEGEWQPPVGYRAIVNPGGVGQPRDGDSRAAFMIYDTEHGFTFYRVPYNIEKTQEKIIKARLPQYLATRLTYGR